MKQCKKVVGILVFAIAMATVGTIVVDGVLGNSEVLAADEAAEEEAAPTGSQVSMIDNIIASGWCGFLIIGMSVYIMALTFQFHVNIKEEVLAPQDLVEQLEELFESEEYDEAMELCEENDCYLTRVVGAGLSRIDSGYDSMVDAVESVGEDEGLNTMQRIGYMLLAANIAPMMGLLGTVLGMVGAFNKLADSGGGANPGALAGDISMALMTTCLGLVVAIPGTIVYAIIKNRFQKVVLEVGLLTGNMLDGFRSE